MAWEPAFGQDLEWCFLHAMSQLGRPGGRRRTSGSRTRPIDPALAAVPEDAGLRAERRRQALAGGYRLRASTLGRAPEVALAVMGAIVPEVVRAAEVLGATAASRPGSSA